MQRGILLVWDTLFCKVCIAFSTPLLSLSLSTGHSPMPTLPLSSLERLSFLPGALFALITHSLCSRSLPLFPLFLLFLYGHSSILLRLNIRGPTQSHHLTTATPGFQLSLVWQRNN